MKLKIKKRDFVFLVTSLLIAIPIIIAGLVSAPAVFGAVNRSFFVVELTVGGRTPIVFYVNWSASGASGNLVDGSKSSFVFSFNVSDLDGFDDLDYTKIVANITLGRDNGLQFFNATSCNYTVYNINYTFFDCAVLFDYYANATNSWVVNISVVDDAGLSAYNDTMRFTVNSLTAMRLVKTAVNFSSGASAGAADVAAATNPFIINNTGNFDFSKINITAQNLTGVTSGGVITPGNITVNSTDSAKGTPMVAAGAVSIPNANLTHGAPGLGNLSLYFYIDVPIGVTAQVYNVTYPWEITLE